MFVSGDGAGSVGETSVPPDRMYLDRMMGFDYRDVGRRGTVSGVTFSGSPAAAAFHGPTAPTAGTPPRILTSLIIGT